MGVPQRKTEFRIEIEEIPLEFYGKICKIFFHRIFSQKLINASGRDFYSLYDVIFNSKNSIF
jgi:hypothetical protein